MLNDPSFRDYIIFNRVRYAHSEVQAYDSYDNLAKDATTTKKVEGGFALNLKLFTIGAKTTYNNTFHSFQSTDEKTAAGRLDLFYYDSKIQIDNLSYVQKKIGYSYFRRSFTESLYNSPMTEILEKHGPLVVFGYYTGGRATALYQFNKLDGVKQTNTNRSINALIGATFNWASDGSKRDSSKTWSGGASMGMMEAMALSSSVAMASPASITRSPSSVDLQKTSIVAQQRMWQIILSTYPLGSTPLPILSIMHS